MVEIRKEKKKQIGTKTNCCLKRDEIIKRYTEILSFRNFSNSFVSCDSKQPKEKKYELFSSIAAASST